MIFNQKRQLGTTTDNWKRGKRMKVHMSNVDWHLIIFCSFCYKFIFEDFIYLFASIFYNLMREKREYGKVVLIHLFSLNLPKRLSLPFCLSGLRCLRESRPWIQASASQSSPSLLAKCGIKPMKKQKEDFSSNMRRTRSLQHLKNSSTRRNMAMWSAGSVGREESGEQGTGGRSDRYDYDL